jgi:hypothetical protein
MIDSLIIATLISSLIGPTLVEYIKVKLINRIKTKKTDPIKEALEMDNLVSEQLEEMITELNCDRVWISQFHNGGNLYPTGKSIQKFSIFHEKLSLGTFSLKEIFKNIPVSIFANTFSELLKNKEILISSYGEQSIPKFGLDNFNNDFNNKSSYVFSLFDLQEHYVGNIGIDYTKKEHILSKEELEYIRIKKTTIETLISTYLYKQSQKYTK